MKKILLFLLVASIVLSALVFVSCNTTVNNADFNEYSQKATTVLKAQNSTQTTAKEVKRNDDTFSRLFAEIGADSQRVEVYYQSAYRQYCELTFKIPLAVGYAGNKFHQMDTFFQQVFMETAITGSEQYICTYKIDENNYVTKMVAPMHYVQTRFFYASETDFWFEWVSLDAQDHSLLAYYYGDSSHNLVGFGQDFASIHIGQNPTGWTTSNSKTIEFFHNTVQIDVNMEDVETDQTTLPSSACTVITDKQFADAIFVMLDKPIADDGTDFEGWRNLGKVDTVFSYSGEDVDTLTIPAKYTKLSCDFTILSRVRKLVIPKTVTTVVDENGNPTNLQNFVLSTSKYVNGQYNNYILQEIVVEDGSPLFSTKDGNLFTKDGKKLLYIVDNPNVSSIDLRCQELGQIDFETPRQYLSNVQSIVVDMVSLPFLYNHALYLASPTTLNNLTIYGWNEPTLCISVGALGLENFRIGELTIHGNFNAVELQIEEGDFGQVNYFSTQAFSVSGWHGGIENLLVSQNSTQVAGSGVWYKNLRTIVVEEGVTDVNLSNISSDQVLEVHLPSTIQNVHGMPLGNGSEKEKIVYVPYQYYWRNKLMEFPQISFFANDNSSWTIRLNESATQQEQYIVQSFKNVVSNGGASLNIVNYYGTDTTIRIPDQIVGIPVETVMFQQSLDQDYFIRHGESASWNFQELYLPQTVHFYSWDGSAHFNTVYFDGTMQQFYNMQGEWYDKVVCENGTITQQTNPDNITQEVSFGSMRLQLNDSEQFIELRELILQVTMDGEKSTSVTGIVDGCQFDEQMQNNTCQLQVICGDVFYTVRFEYNKEFVGYAHYNAVLNLQIFDMDNKLVAYDSTSIQQ